MLNPAGQVHGSKEEPKEVVIVNVIDTFKPQSPCDNCPNNKTDRINVCHCTLGTTIIY